MTSPATLHTDRLTLRPWRDADLAPFADLNADPAVMQHFPAVLRGVSMPRFDAAFTPCVELGWRLCTESWGRGYATEAARAAVDFGFRQLENLAVEHPLRLHVLYRLRRP